MPTYKKLLRLQRAPLASRGEWSLLLVTALCALLAISPAVGAPLAVSSFTVSSLSTSSAPVSEAMLWWLGNQLSAQQSTASAACRAILPQNSDPQEVAALLAAFEHAASLHFDDPANHNLIKSTTAAPALTEIAAPEYCLSYPPLAIAPRYDATRRLMQYSLTTPEAATRSGLRTNRYHE